jgi:AraC-like DNA-binding protein
MRAKDFEGRASGAESLRELLRASLAAQAERLLRGRAALQVPVPPRTLKSPGKAHFHHGFELVLQCAGRSEWRLPDGLVRVDADGMLLLPRGLVHREGFDARVGPSCNLNIGIGPDSVGYHSHVRERAPGGGGARTPARGWVRSESAGLIFDMLEHVADLYESGAGEGDVLVRALMLSALELIRRALEVGGDEGPALSPLVGACRHEVLRFLSDPAVNVSWLAARLGCNPDYLSHLFRRETGRRLSAFINDERLKLARHLLGGGAMSIGQVAAACGYADPNYFARVFRRRTGRTPREFRMRRAGR